MSIKVSKDCTTIATHPMLVQNVPSFCGMHGVFKNGVDPHALVTERFSLVWLRLIIKVQDFSQVGTIADGLEFALPRGILRIVVQCWKVVQIRLPSERLGLLSVSVVIVRVWT